MLFLIFLIMLLKCQWLCKYVLCYRNKLGLSLWYPSQQLVSIQNPVTSKHMWHPVPHGWLLCLLLLMPSTVLPEQFYGTPTPLFF